MDAMHAATTGQFPDGRPMRHQRRCLVQAVRSVHLAKAELARASLNATVEFMRIAAGTSAALTGRGK